MAKSTYIKRRFRLFLSNSWPRWPRFRSLGLVLSYKAQIAIKREKAFEFTIEWSNDMKKFNKKYR
jgi:hypothetical protein